MFTFPLRLHEALAVFLLDTTGGDCWGDDVDIAVEVTGSIAQPRQQSMLLTL